MARAYLDVSPELLVDFFTVLEEGDPRIFDVVKNGLPKDARPVGCTTYWPKDSGGPEGSSWVRITIESDHVEEGSVLDSPQIDVQYPPKEASGMTYKDWG